MKVVRVESAKFTATFQTDGIVREADAPIRFMIGWHDAKVRAVIKKNHWRAVIIAGAGLEDFRKLEISEESRKAPDYQPQIFLCAVCGVEACFGYGVDLRHGRVGKWYCSAHRESSHAKEINRL